MSCREREGCSCWNVSVRTSSVTARAHTSGDRSRCKLQKAPTVTTTIHSSFIPAGKPVADQLATQIRAAVAEAAGSGMYARDTLDKLEEVTERFARFLQACEVDQLEQVAPLHVETFIKARPSHRSPGPASATQHLRRTNLRILFRFARSLGSCHHDPTADVDLAPRRSPITRPLTDNEIESCRCASFLNVRTGRQAAIWALAETTATTAEIAQITAKDVDLAADTVRLGGSNRTFPRLGRLSPWGLKVLTTWIDDINPQPDDLLVYRHGRGSRQGPAVAIAQTIYHIFERANLTEDPTVRTGSIASWVGVNVFAATGDIAQVANILGLRSLDTAAQRIGWTWTASRIGGEL